MNGRSFASVVVALLAMTALLVLLMLMVSTSTDVPRPAQAAPPLAAPTVTEVDPASAPNDLDVPIVITGTDFAVSATVQLDGVSLDDAGWVSSATLTATVPWGMDPGVYTLTVTNPGEGSGSLPDAFTVTQGIGVWNAGELYGGNIHQVIVNPITPTTLYAASSDVGLFRSRDGGETWSLKLAPWAKNLTIDPVSPNRIYLEGYYPHHGPVYRSDDEGETWNPLTITFPITQTLGRECWGGFVIYPHPTTSGIVYIHACEDGSGGSGLIRSTNWGQDWVPAMGGLTDTQVTALAFHPDDPDVMYLGTASGNVFRSSDGGAWWTYASRPVGFVARLAVNPFGGREVWVSSRDEFGDSCALLKSANADLTAWTTMEPVLGEPACAESAIRFAPEAWSGVYSGTAFVAGHGSVYKTSDGGDTWAPFGPDAIEIHDVALHPMVSGTLYIGDSRYGVHRTTDGGGSWQIVNQGLTAMFPEHLSTVPGQPEVVYAGFRFQSGVFWSTRGGATWQVSQIGDEQDAPASLLVDPSDPTRVYAGLLGRVYASTDGGMTWPTYGEIVPPPQYVGCNQIPRALLAVPGQPGTLLAGVQHWGGSAAVWPGSIYRSIDYGGHWVRVYPTATQAISQVNALACDAVTPTIVYAATGGSGMLRSTDGGQTWEPTGEDIAALDSAKSKSIAVESVPPYRVFVMTECPLPYLYVSEDHGLSWTQANSPLDPSNVAQILGTDAEPSVLYAAAAQGLSRSTDGAQSWQRAAGVLGHIPVYSLATVTATERVILYAGTTGGVVEGSAARAWRQGDTDNSTLVAAGVYRWTTRITRVYLPLAFRGYAP